MTASTKKKLLLIALVCIGLILASKIFGLNQYLSVDNFRKLFSENFYISASVFIILFTVANLIYIPGVVFLSASIVVLGKADGLSLTFVAAVISCICSYFTVGLMGKSLLREIDNKLAKRLFAYMDQYPLAANIGLRFCFQTSPTLNYSLALSGVKFRDYILGSLIGLPVPLIIYTYFFDSIFKAS